MNAVPGVAVVVALAGVLVRWWLQGSHNLYTALDKRFYVPDPDLGWRVSPHHPIWLGLDVCAVIFAIAATLAIGLWMLRRRRATVVRAIAWLVGAATLAAPIAAFASGGRPDRARDELPSSVTEALDIGGVVDGSLDAPPGTYEVIPHDGTSITAHLSAGGESFDARFTGDVRGSWRGDPHDLTAPMSGELSVAAASVDTGVRDRSRHARGYLKAATYPRIAVTLDRIVAAHATAPRTLAFRARGTLSLIGRTHAIEISGTIAQPDADGLARLGLSGSVLLVTAGFSIRIADTALAADAGDFNVDRIPIAVSLVLRRTP